MKFLCRNCKAKYQIADDKVAGRTLRMTCQQCGEPIVVRGAPSRAPAALQPLHAARPQAPAALGATQQQTALGADFHRQLNAPASRDLAVPAHEEWHVAINDVPVGPMRRDEVARKIAMGAIDRESLAWREGMDDWLALKHIGELSVLFASSAPSKSGSPPSAASMPSVVSAGPAVRAEMAPIGGRQVVAVEEYEVSAERDALPELTVSAVASPAHAEASAPSKPPWGPMFALVCCGAFILAAGAWLGVRVLAPAPSAPVAAAAPAPAAAPNNAVAQAAPSPGPSTVIELDTQPIDGTANPAARRSGVAAAPAPAAVDKKTGKQLTAEQKEMLARMGGGTNQGLSNIHALSDTPTSAAQGAGALTAAQLSAVVNGGRKNLQRCYETALRGANSTDAVRLDVEISVSASGNVTTVHAAGKNLPGMEECITRTVKMWRFPMSAESTQTRFPLVFQPGA
jgi:hypothetical protein